MAQTAVVNKRRRKRRHNAKRRRRNHYGAATPNRRRRRRHSSAPRRSNRRRRYSHRRRNPGTPSRSPYSSGGYYRAPNPGMFDFEDLTEVMPAATAGIWAGRYALKQAGAFEPAKDGTLEPGLKHAIALWIAANFGGQLIGQLFGDVNKGRMATIAAFGFAGDLFLRTRFMKDSAFVKDNLSLQGLGDGDLDYGSMSGFQSHSQIGAVEDSAGNQWVQTPQGWVLAGPGVGQGTQLVQTADGTVYEMGRLDSLPGSGSRLAGFQSHSQIGQLGMRRANPNSQSSFGYAPGV